MSGDRNELLYDTMALFCGVALLNVVKRYDIVVILENKVENSRNIVW